LTDWRHTESVDWLGTSAGDLVNRTKSRQVGGQMGDMGALVIGGADMTKIPLVYEVPKTYAVNLTSLDGLKDDWRVPEDVIAKSGLVIDQTGSHKK
jgi:hypothetical protein